MGTEYPRALYHETLDPIQVSDPVEHATRAKEGFGTWDEVHGAAERRAAKEAAKAAKAKAAVAE